MVVLFFAGTAVTVARVAGSPITPKNAVPVPRIDNKTFPSQAVVNIGLPARLVIPKLNVNARVELMGVTSSGAMDVPSDITEAGWYKYGAHPGDDGSAVISGHLDGIHGEPGVFLNLRNLRVADNFSVLDDSGKTTQFIVRYIRTYDQNEQPNEVFHSQQGSHLNLITCTGAWNRFEKRFSKRLVVFADKAN